MGNSRDSRHRSRPHRGDCLTAGILGPRSARRHHAVSCPDWDGGTWCDACRQERCSPWGTTLLREVCCVLWPWAADAIRKRSPPPGGDEEIPW